MATEVFHPTETPSFGQKAFDIICEEQARMQRRKRTSGIHTDDRPVIQFGDTYSVIHLVNYVGEKMGKTTIERSERQQVVFDSQILRRLLLKAEPGKTVKAGGRAWYHHTDNRCAPEWDKKTRHNEENNHDYHAKVYASFQMEFSADAQTAIIEMDTKPLKGQPNTEPIETRTMIFNAHPLPDIAGMFAQRLDQVPR